MTAMIRLPERWQVADTLSGEKTFAATLASRFEAGDRKQSRFTWARWRRLRCSDITGSVTRPASDIGTKRFAVRATADSVAGEKPVLGVAHGTLVELQTSRQGVNELKH